MIPGCRPLPLEVLSNHSHPSLPSFGSKKSVVRSGTLTAGPRISLAFGEGWRTGLKFGEDVIVGTGEDQEKVFISFFLGCGG